MNSLNDCTDDRLTDPLIASLHDSVPEVRRGAAQLLGKIGEMRAVPPLIDALQDDAARLQALQALGQIGDRRALQPLIQALQDPDDYLQHVAAASLGQIGDPQAVAPLAAVLQAPASAPLVKRRVIQSLVQIGTQRAVEPLAGALLDADEQTSLEAARALQRPRHVQQALPLLCRALQEAPSAQVRLMVVEKLEDVAGDQAIDALIGALQDSIPIARTAARTLGRVGDTRAVAALCLAFKWQDTTLNQYATAALKRICDGQAIEPLSRMLHNDSRDVRRIAAEMLLDLYRSDALTTEDRQRLLSERNTIVSPHQDIARQHEDARVKTSVHKDVGGGKCLYHHDIGRVHRDIPGQSHRDTGIGLDFPL